MNKLTIVVLMVHALGVTAVAQDVFLPGIVSTGDTDFNACFSADSQSFYFSRSINGKSAIYVTHQDHSGWSAPTRLPFCADGFSYADPAFSPSGEFYFISNRPIDKGDTIADYNIWKSLWIDNHWTPVLNVTALNSESDEYYISFDKLGNAYFSSSRADGYGEEDLYTATLDENEKFGNPVNLGPDVNSVHSEYDPFVSPNGNILIFASSGQKDGLGKADLYWAEKLDVWGNVKHLERVNTPTRDYCAYVSSNGYFYFSSEGEVKRILLNNLPNRLHASFKRQADFLICD